LSVPYEDSAKDFLELSSHQRISIIFGLEEKKSKVSMMAKQLDATSQEVSRNFERLVKAGLITKDKDGYYVLSTFGRAICTQVPSLVFLSQNRKYFEKHNFEDIPLKFIQRIGALVRGKYVKGFVKVQEQWREIYYNADKYVYNILSELSLDLIKLAIEKTKNNVKISNIFSESTIVPKGRKQLLEKVGFRKLLQDRKIERKMQKDVKVVVVLNEKEACISFPLLDDESDLSQAFYSDDIPFHEWCLDYFRYCWHGADDFRESKIKE